MASTGCTRDSRVRAAAAEELLRDPATLIVLVTTAEQERVEQAQEFVGALSDRGLRSRRGRGKSSDGRCAGRAAITRAKLPAVLKRKLRRNLADFTALKNRELIALEVLRASLPPAVPIIAAAELRREPRSLKELAAFAGSFDRDETKAATDRAKSSSQSGSGRAL